MRGLHGSPIHPIRLSHRRRPSFRSGWSPPILKGLDRHHPSGTTRTTHPPRTPKGPISGVFGSHGLEAVRCSGPLYGQRTGGPMTDSQRMVAIRVEVPRIGRYAARREYEGGAEGARVRP